MGRTTELRRALKQRFYPLVAARGFVLDQAHAPFDIDFRRIRSHRVDVFDIQWEKYGRPRFVINFGRCPSRGVIHRGETVPPEKLLSYMGDEHGRLQPGKRLGSRRSWFCQDLPLLRRVLVRRSTRPAEEVVDQLLILFPELEDWFDTGNLGPHMHLSAPLGLSVPIAS